MLMWLLAACIALMQTTSTILAVTVDAGVVDANGRSVSGLVVADFTVELEGQPRRVVAATYYPAGAPMSGAIGPAFDAVSGSPPVYRLTIQPPGDTQPGREFAIVVRVNRAGAKVQAPAAAVAVPVTVTGKRAPIATARSETVNTQRTVIDTLLVSRIRRWTEDANGRMPLTDELPAGVTTIGATVELSLSPGSAVPADLLIALTLGTTGPNAATLIERIVTPVERDGVLAADAEFPLERFAPGTYRLTATVKSGTRVLGAIDPVLVIKR
jgi:hypothetical protein